MKVTNLTDESRGLRVLCETIMPRIAMPILINEIVATVMAIISPYSFGEPVKNMVSENAA